MLVASDCRDCVIAQEVVDMFQARFNENYNTILQEVREDKFRGDDPEISTVRSPFTAIEKDWFPEIAAIKPPGDLCLFGGLLML